MGPRSRRFCKFLTQLQYSSALFNRSQVKKCKPPIIPLDVEGKTTMVTNKMSNVRSRITKSSKVTRSSPSELVTQQTKGQNRPTGMVPSVPALPESLARLMNEIETPLGLHV